MPRPRKDGSAASPARKRKLTELFVKRVRAEPRAFVVWDTHQHGLALKVQPTGARAYKTVYRYHNRPRWFHLGNARAISLGDARKLAARVMLQAAEDADPVAVRKAERGAGTFAELHSRYIDEFAKRRNKSWKQADALMSRYVLPRLGRHSAKSITRADVRAVIAKIDNAPILANQVLAAASAVFSWGVRMEVLPFNPIKGIERHEAKSRERVLSDREIKQFWEAFDAAGLIKSAALKTILLTGQRPGEVAHLRREHIVDGWWEMPGAPQPKLGWPGTKNGESHRVWLSAPARAVLDELNDGSDAATGFVFAGNRGKPVAGLPVAMRAICAAVGVNE